MDEINIRFSHLAENIFDKLNDKTLAKCRFVSKKWQAYIDNQKTLHIRKIKTIIEEFHEVGESWEVFFKAKYTEINEEIQTVRLVSKLYTCAFFMSTGLEENFSQ